MHLTMSATDSSAYKVKYAGQGKPVQWVHSTVQYIERGESSQNHWQEPPCWRDTRAQKNIELQYTCEAAPSSK